MVLGAFFWDYPGKPLPEEQTVLDFAEVEMMGWHQPDHMQVICTLLQADNQASTTSQVFTDRVLFLPPCKISDTENRLLWFIQEGNMHTTGYETLN